jgi:hypothetical protein
VIRATPLEAARRQLDAAIRLLFAGEDALAVHTLAFASYKLLSDIAKSGECSPTLAMLQEDAALAEGKAFWNCLNELANELKHGDREPKAMLRGVPEEFNEALLLVGCFFLRELDRLASPETQALWLWHHALFFIDIDDTPPACARWLATYHAQLHAQTRQERIEIGSALLAELRKGPAGDHRMEPSQRLLPWRLVIRFSPAGGAALRRDG